MRAFLILLLAAPPLLFSGLPLWAEVEDEDISLLFSDSQDVDEDAHSPASPTAPPGALETIKPGAPPLPPGSAAAGEAAAASPAAASVPGPAPPISPSPPTAPPADNPTAPPAENPKAPSAETENAAAAARPQTLPPLTPRDLAALGRAPDQAPSAAAAAAPEAVAPEGSGETLLAPQSTRVTGSVVEPPPPSWIRSSREPAGGGQGSGPLPDFDTSQSRWRVLEVGTFTRPGSPGKAPDRPIVTAPGAPRVVPAQGSPGPPGPGAPQPPASPHAPAPGAPAAPGNSPETPPAAAGPRGSGADSSLTELFSDMLPDLTPATPAPAKLEEPQNQGNPTVRGSLNGLMEDQPPASEGDPSPAFAPESHAPAGAALPPEAPSVPLLPPPLSGPVPGAASGPSSGAPAKDGVAAAKLPPIAEPVKADPEAGLAIERSGRLLAEDGPLRAPVPHGQSRIVTPSPAPIPGVTPRGSLAPPDLEPPSKRSGAAPRRPPPPPPGGGRNKGKAYPPPPRS
ncbi:MAG: hypothetical protein LBR53_01810, partial [Deltaproteobacteria bacterium]|nr:hypothetical protein [Deltaproteobacteria bacterium]